MTEQYVTRTHRQHTTIVTSIPKGVQMGLGLNKGDYLVWQVDGRSRFVQISKVVAGGKRNAKSDRNTGRKNPGRGTRTKTRE